MAVANSEQLIKINADIETNKRVLIYWVIFFVLVGLFYILTLAVPLPFKRLEESGVTDFQADLLRHNHSQNGHSNPPDRPAAHPDPEV